jgi:hypothetical protein
VNKHTGTKLANLTAPRAILDFFTVLEKGKDSNWSSQEFLVLRKLANHLLAKSQEAINPISHTSYSAVLVYKKNNNYLLFSGANIDPEQKEDLKNPLKRNCAEKQAAITAHRIDGLDNSHLCFMFLYRKQKLNECVPACKLVPCRDCYEKYLIDLMKNNGRLVLIMDDNVDRVFLHNPQGTQVTEKVHSIDLGEGAFVNYKIFDAKAMQFLKIEDSLGERVCKV